MEDAGAEELARRARGTPRIAIRLLQRARDFAQVEGDGRLTRDIVETTGLSLDKLPVFIAMNAAAYLIGYVSFITPSGLGFREGALVAFLSPFFPTPVAVALALAARLWSTAGEMLGVLIAVLPTSNEKSNSLSGIARSETTNLRPR